MDTTAIVLTVVGAALLIGLIYFLTRPQIPGLAPVAGAQGGVAGGDPTATAALGLGGALVGLFGPLIVNEINRANRPSAEADAADAGEAG